MPPTSNLHDQLRMVSVGRISIDLYPEQQGPISAVTTFRKSVGGTATNVAVAAARLGHHVALVTKVGNDQFGRSAVAMLADKFGVNTSYISKHNRLQTPLAFAELDPPEDPDIIFYREPQAPDMNLSPEDIVDVPLSNVDIFWVPASRFSDEPSCSTVTEMLHRRNGKEHTIFDLDWRPTFWDSKTKAAEKICPVLDRFTIAIGNRDECEIVVKTRDPEIAATRLLEEGLQTAIVKLGADGVLVADNSGRRELVPPFPVDAICGLGAGDAFGGAFCHGLLSGWTVTESVRYGNAAGAIVASRLLCADDMPFVEEIEEFVSSR